MKRLTLFFALLIIPFIHSQGQVALEYSFTGVSASYINLPVAGYKYYVMDVTNRQCKIYNNDHSLWKTINLTIPTGYTLCDIQYVTENLFNNDNSIELLYVSYLYNTASAYYTYDTRLASESGTVLLDVPGGGYSVVYPAQTGSKLFIWIYDYSVSPYTVSTNVYTIPGQTFTGVQPQPASSQGSVGNAFPNPAVSSVTIPYVLPSSVQQAQLKLYDITGKIVKSFTIDHSFDNITIQTGELPAGMYLYRIESGNYRSPSYRISVSK